MAGGERHVCSYEANRGEGWAIIKATQQRGVLTEHA